MKNILNRLYHFLLPIIPDKPLIQLKFKSHMGYTLDLKNPKTLNEKINWLKLNDRTPLHTQCSDKFLVRAFVENKIGKEFLVPLYYHTKNPSDIRPENVHSIPCIIKANHDSSGGIFIYDKSKVDWKTIQKSLGERLKSNYYLRSREWQYKNIEPRIIVEKLLVDKNGNIPFDFKLHCLNGKVRMISVDMGRGTDKHFRNWYNTKWEREPYSWSSPKENGKATIPSINDVPKPDTLEEMIRLSEILAQSFMYVRVDWYDLNGKLFFGELTFHHDGGFRPILPKSWDVRLGQELKLIQNA